MAKHNPKTRLAFTIAEMLVCLAIFALILTAVAAAFQASGNNYNENRNMSDAMSMARLALTRMSTQMRTASAISPDDPSNQCSLITSDAQNIVFKYDSSTKTLKLEKGTSSYTLCENVENMVFTPHTNASGNVKSIEISITVKAGSATQTLGTAVVLRKMV